MWEASIAVPRLDGLALAPLLDALSALNLRYLRELWMPLYRSGVRYQREGRGQESWATVPIVLQRGVGDCEDLSCWRAAELRLSGIDARAIALERPRRHGRLYHVVVRLPDGSIEDPSKRLGM